MARDEIFGMPPESVSFEEEAVLLNVICRIILHFPYVWGMHCPVPNSRCYEQQCRFSKCAESGPKK